MEPDIVHSESLVAKIAKKLHDVWVDDAKDRNIVYGKNRTETTHPHLVEFEELDEKSKDKDKYQACILLHKFINWHYKSQMTPSRKQVAVWLHESETEALILAGRSEGHPHAYPVELAHPNGIMMENHLKQAEWVLSLLNRWKFGNKIGLKTTIQAAVQEGRIGESLSYNSAILEQSYGEVYITTNVDGALIYKMNTNKQGALFIISESLLKDSSHPICVLVIGKSGSGKTCLGCNVWAQLEGDKKEEGSLTGIPHKNKPLWVSFKANDTISLFWKGITNLFKKIKMEDDQKDKVEEETYTTSISIILDPTVPINIKFHHVAKLMYTYEFSHIIFDGISVDRNNVSLISQIVLLASHLQATPKWGISCLILCDCGNDNNPNILYDYLPKTTKLDLNLCFADLTGNLKENCNWPERLPLKEEDHKAWDHNHIADQLSTSLLPDHVKPFSSMRTLVGKVVDRLDSSSRDLLFQLYFIKYLRHSFQQVLPNKEIKTLLEYGLVRADPVRGTPAIVGSLRSHIKDLMSPKEYERALRLVLQWWKGFLSPPLKNLLNSAKEQKWPFIPEKWQFEGVTELKEVEEEELSVGDIIQEPIFSNAEEKTTGVQVLFEALGCAMELQEWKEAAGIMFLLDRYLFRHSEDKNVHRRTLEYLKDRTAIAPQLIIRIGRILTTQGDLGKANRILRSLKNHKSELVRAVALQVTGEIEMQLGNLNRAIKLLSKTIKVFDELDPKKGSSSSYSLMGIAYMRKREYERSCFVANKAFSLCREQKMYAGKAMRCVAEALLMMEKWTEALEAAKKAYVLIEKSRSFSESTMWHFEEVRALFVLSQAHFHMGKIERSNNELYDAKLKFRHFCCTRTVLEDIYHDRQSLADQALQDTTEPDSAEIEQQIMSLMSPETILEMNEISTKPHSGSISEKTETMTESDTEPITEPATEPITESDTEPITESDTETMTESDTEPITESATEPIIESDTEPILELSKDTEKTKLSFITGEISTISDISDVQVMLKYEWDSKEGKFVKGRLTLVHMASGEESARIGLVKGGTRIPYFAWELTEGGFGSMFVVKSFIRESWREHKRPSRGEATAQMTARDVARHFNYRVVETTGNVPPGGEVTFLPVIILRTVSQHPPWKKKNMFYSLEPYIKGKFEKLSNNTTYLRSPFAATFSHFSYVLSNEKSMVVDIQGWPGQGNIWTDPQLHTRDQKYEKVSGVGDRGVKGFQDFFSKHTCNKLCKKLKLQEIRL